MAYLKQVVVSDIKTLLIIHRELGQAKKGIKKLQARFHSIQRSK